MANLKEIVRILRNLAPSRYRESDVSLAVNSLNTLTRTIVDELSERSALVALAQAKYRRVDFVMIGDSNQQMDGYGFDGSFNTKLTARFGMYATPIYGGTGGQSQGGVNVSGNGGIGAATGAPTQLEQLAMGSKPYGYLASGTFNTGGNGLTISNVPGVNVNASWRLHFAYGTFDSGSGSFKLGVRRNDSPYSTVMDGPLINTNTGAFSKVYNTLDLPAAARNFPFEFKWYRQGSTVITAPFLAYWYRAENLDASAGVSCHTLYGAGGESLWDFNNALNGFSNASLTEYFSEIRRLQLVRGLEPIVVFYINSGLNDRNETSSPSWGFRGNTTPSSGEAYYDNLQAILYRIRDIWESAGWSEDELYFMFMPSHPISLPDDANLIKYRRAAKELARHERCTFIDISKMITSAQILANGWYKSSGADTSHMTVAGYDAITDMVVSLIPDL